MADQPHPDESLRLQQLANFTNLAGGIAHDLNNILTVIRGYAEQIVHGTSADERNRQGALQIVAACSRAASLSSQLRMFSPKKDQAPVLMEVEALFGATTKMLSRFLGEDIELKVQHDPQLGQARVRPGAVEHLLMSAAIAARQQMPNGGTLCMGAQRTEPTTQGQYVQFRIVSPDVQLQFTHEQLPFCRQLSSAENLRLGPSFDLLLPLEADSTAPSAEGTGWSSLPQGTETILLVEDDLALLEMSAMALKQLGYKVLQAADPQEALRIAEHNPDLIIDLLVADLVLPKMSGRDLATWLLAIHPEANVLYISAYPNSGSDSSLESGAPFLPKPFSLQELAAAVRKALAP